MALKRLGVTLFSHVYLLILAVAFALPPGLLAQVTPDHEIVPVETGTEPLWKKYWDSGREYARQENYQTAAEFYEKLLSEKPQIEEAKWEYCKILFHIDRFAEASTLLEGLIEGSPYNTDYLTLAGFSSLKTGEYGRAVRYLGQVYSLHPGGEEGVHTLRGLIEGLIGLGKRKNAFILMEQLHQRVPDDISLMHELGRMAYELGYTNKAADYYLSLIHRYNAGDDITAEAARMFLVTGEEEKAVPLWKSLLKGNPDNQEYHKRLLEYYQKTGAAGEALPHLLSLVESEKKADPRLLLETARIYLHHRGRADKALRYYERYLATTPDDQKAVSELKLARERIADELLAIVENEGAKPLWNDLKNFTDNRIAIYQLMAEKLGNSGKTLPLIHVLELLYEHTPGNTDAMALKLAELYIAAGRKDEAYAYLLKVSDRQYHTYQYYRQKADLELLFGYDIAAMDSLLLALAKRPDLNELRGDCLRLAGQMGRVSTMQELAKPLTASPPVEENFELYLDYLDGLRFNGQYTLAGSLYSLLLGKIWSHQRYQEELLLHQAETLNSMGLAFESQKILRTLFVSGKSDRRVVAQLIDHALESGSAGDGRALLDYYTRTHDNGSWRSRFDNGSMQFFLSYFRLLEEEGRYPEAAAELNAYRVQYNNQPDAGKVRQGLNTLDLELCRLYLKAGERDKCRTVIANSRAAGQGHKEKLLMQDLVLGEGIADLERRIQSLPGVREKKGGLQALFVLAEQAETLADNKAALIFLDKILELQPQSMRAMVKKATLLKRMGLPAEASALYRNIWQENPAEIVFLNEFLQLEFRMGHYEAILSLLEKKNFQELPPELQLLKTRTVWALGAHDQAFSLYEEILTPSVSTRFRELVAEKNLLFTWQEKEKQDFWDLFRYEQPDQLDKLNNLQGNTGLLSMVNTPLGGIAASLYDSYRWEKLISNEYKVRKAVEENKYIVAEKQYRKDARKEKSTESLKDLAKIYQRLGDYGKEAEVYSYLEKHGEKSPEIQDSIERNKIARAPTLSANYSYLEQKGRDNQINLEKNSAGLSFKYNPSITSALEMGYSELFYASATGEGEELSGRQFNGKGMYAVNDKTSVDLGVGLHIVDSEGESLPLFDFRLNRKFDELLSGYVEFREEIIDDTLDALKESLYTGSVTGGIVLEGTTGINLGGEFRRLWYNDGNDQNRVYLWSSYSIFSKLTTYELKYSYEMLNHKDSDPSAGSSDAGAGFTTAERSGPIYWSPGSYWQHVFSVGIQHQLQDLGEAGQPPSYCSADFSVGYESELAFTYSGSLDIFLEMSSNFLLKGELFYSNNRDYEEQSAAVSVMYRW